MSRRKKTPVNVPDCPFTHITEEWTFVWWRLLCALFSFVQTPSIIWNISVLPILLEKAMPWPLLRYRMYKDESILNSRIELSCKNSSRLLAWSGPLCLKRFAWGFSMLGCWRPVWFSWDFSGRVMLAHVSRSVSTDLNVWERGKSMCLTGTLPFNCYYARGLAAVVKIHI